MKILHVNTEKGWRGGEQQLLYLIRGLRKKGIKCSVACRVGTELERRCRLEGFEVIPLKGNQTSDILRLGLIGKGFDIIHSHSAKGHTISALSKWFHKRPVINTRRVDYKPKENLLTEIKYRLTDHNVAVVGAVKSILKERFPSLEVSVIYSAVDLKEVERKVSISKVLDIKKELGGSPLIGTLAALTEQKDIPNLIMASKEVIKELPNARFVVFGEGKLRKDLETLIQREGLRGKFTLYGFVSDVSNYTKALDLFVLPSRNEGIGGAILIAMALKVPVVATNVGGVCEVVKNEETGLLVPPSNPKALARAILKLLKGKTLRDELTENAYTLIREKFTVESMVNSYIKVYREVLNRWRRNGAPL